MSLDLAAKAVALWAGILVLAVLNGLLRERVLVPALGAVPGQVLSGLLLSALILGATWLCLPWLACAKADCCWAWAWAGWC